MKGYFRVSPIKHNAPGLPEYTIFSMCIYIIVKQCYNISVTFSITYLFTVNISKYPTNE